MSDRYGKVGYVSKALQTRPHSCHWPGCSTQVPPAMWGCRKHWFSLPQSIRNRIWATYRPGQETTRVVSDAYLAVAKAAQEWIAKETP